MNRMEEMRRQQRAAAQQQQQQQPGEMGSLPRSNNHGRHDVVLWQQQLLRQEQYQSQQQQRSSNPMMQDFSMAASQGNHPSLSAGTGMPSLMEISRAEEILAAARDAIMAGVSPGRTSGGGGQFASMPGEDFNASVRSMLNQPNTRWTSDYDPTPLRPPGAAQVTPIGTRGLGNQDFQMQFSQQNQGGFPSLATAHAPPQHSSMAMRQAMINQMPSDNMGVLDPLLMRQEEEERVAMGGKKRQRDSSGGDDYSRAKMVPGPSGFLGGGMGGSHPLTDNLLGANKNLMLQRQQGFEGAHGESPKPRRRHAKTFPVKLMECLMAHYDERYVAWLPDGRSFVIVHPVLFIENIISQTFKNSKYVSFVRKLYRWGFARLTSATGADCFYHPLFQRDRIDLAAQILCMPRNDSPSVKKRAKLGIQPPAAPIITASDVPPENRPSHAGVEKFFAGSEEHEAAGRAAITATATAEGSGNATESESDEDNRKRRETTKLWERNWCARCT